MMKKTTAMLLALLMSAALCGCGDPFAEALLKDESLYDQFASSAETTESAKAADVSETAGNESSAAEETAETPETAGEENTSAPEPGSEEELAEVVRVSKQYIQALANNDMELLVDSFDMDLYYYMQNNEPGDREKHLALAQEVFGEKLESHRGNTTEEQIDEFVKSPVYAPEKADEYNAFLKKMDEIGQGKTAYSNLFYIDGAYLYRIQNQAAADAGGQAGSGLQFSIGTGETLFGMDLAVLHINGEWKVDAALPILMDMINNMEQSYQ